ncbi:MAG: site-2 protease family protein [bacterium]|nr:site-2 protease family protein [bacterium]
MNRSAWNLPLGTLCGIRVTVHGSFLILLAVVGVVQWVSSGSFVAASLGLASILVIFGCVLLHELGHALAARRYGIGTRSITLLPIGGVAQLERMPEDPRQELVVALAGPAVNLVIAAAAFGLLQLAALTGSALLAPALSFLVIANVILFAFNLLPAFPMDGGRVLRAGLALRLGGARATEIAASTGKLMAVAFAVLGFLYNPMLVLIALFVWFGASQEALWTRTRASLDGMTASDAMTRDFHAVDARAPLRYAAEVMLGSQQKDYPVLDDGRIVGVLLRADVLRALSARDARLVSDVMRSGAPAARTNEPLGEVYRRLIGGPLPALPVVDGPHIVGWITREGINEYVALRRRLGAA